MRDRLRVLGSTEHTHTRRLLPDGDACVLEDQVEWRTPFTSLGGDTRVRKELGRVFAWRHRVTRVDLERSRDPAARALVVGVTGASGFLGRALCTALAMRGHRAMRFVRAPAAARAGEIAWDPARGELDYGQLAGLDAVIHLAGASLAGGRWTPERKRELIESRVLSTATLARALSALCASSSAMAAGHVLRRPRVLVSASAVGWYGNRGQESVHESSAPGEGFLAELTRQWEDAAEPARAAGLRVVHPRMGIVLWPGEGALAKLAAPFYFGVGGPLGNGRAWWSWITLHDLLDALLFAVEHDSFTGAFNAVAPQPVRQREIARAIGRALSRPALMPAPEIALRMLLGREQADEMLFASQRVVARALIAAGFTFRDPELAPALKRLFGVPRLEPVA